MVGHEITPIELLAQLRETVDNLAAPAEAQIASLAAGGFPVDELALELDDEVPRWFPRLTDAGLLDDDARQRLLHLDAALEAITFAGDAELWTPDGLRTRGEWNVIRALARRAVVELERCAGG